MQFRLLTLLTFAGTAPPAMAVVWFRWREIVVVAVIMALLALWFWISLSIARFFGWLVASTMG